MASDEAGHVNRARADEAEDYLRKHQILELFNNLLSQTIFTQPENPKEYIIEILQKLQQAKSTQQGLPCLFDDSNIVSIFGMLDPTGSGFISLKQYEAAMITLGVKNFETKPEGHDVDKIAFDTFVIKAKAGLTRTSATFWKP